MGDVLLVVGPQDELDALRVVVGRESDLDLRTMPSAITSKRLIVTRTEASGKTLAELDFIRRFGVQITRISRAEVEADANDPFRIDHLIEPEPPAITARSIWRAHTADS